MLESSVTSSVSSTSMAGSESEVASMAVSVVVSVVLPALALSLTVSASTAGAPVAVPIVSSAAADAVAGERNIVVIVRNPSRLRCVGSFRCARKVSGTRPSVRLFEDQHTRVLAVCGACANQAAFNPAVITASVHPEHLFHNRGLDGLTG